MFNFLCGVGVVEGWGWHKCRRIIKMPIQGLNYNVSVLLIYNTTIPKQE